MKPFYEALDHADERPVRIAYFGDSFIEADILTGDLRDMLQARFGGCGVGYVDITSGTYGFRKTLRHSFAGWTSKGVNDSTGYDRKRIGPSGHYFIPHRGAYVEARPPKAHRGQLDSCEVATIYFEATDTVLLATRVNGIDGDTGPLAGKGQMQAVEREGLIKSMRWTVEKSRFGHVLRLRPGRTHGYHGGQLRRAQQQRTDAGLHPARAAAAIRQKCVPTTSSCSSSASTWPPSADGTTAGMRPACCVSSNT